MTPSYFLMVLIFMIPSSFTGYVIFRLICLLAKPREMRPVKIITFIVLGMIANTSMFLVDVDNVLIALIVFFIIMLIGFKGSVLHKVSAVIVFYPLVVASQIIITNSLRFLGLRQLICTIVFWLVIYLIFKNRLTGVFDLPNNKVYILLDVICSATFTIIIAMVTSMNNKTIAVLASSLTIVTHIGILFLIFTIIENAKNESELKVLQLQKTYYEFLEGEQAAIRKIKHDINNHMHAIDGLIKERLYQQAEAYIGNIFTSLNSSTMKNYSNNPIINLVLNQKLFKIQEMSIDCSLHIEIKNLNKIADMDICSLFSNTLDNAIEACEKITDTSKRYISVKALCKNNYFMYTVINSKESHTRVENGKHITDKTDTIQHGYGISNVKDIVEKYDGEIEIKHNEKEFAVTIIIPQNKLYTDSLD